MAARCLCRPSLAVSDLRVTDASLEALAPRLSGLGAAEGGILEWVGRCRPALRAWVVIEDAVVPGSVPLDALG